MQKGFSHCLSTCRCATSGFIRIASGPQARPKAGSSTSASARASIFRSMRRRPLKSSDSIPHCRYWQGLRARRRARNMPVLHCLLGGINAIFVFIGLFCIGLFLNSVADAQSPSGVVRIGILNDQSGPYADFGGKTSVDAARMAVEDVGGKVLGKSIEIIIGDHQNKPDIASALVRRWFDVDGVSAVAELTNSAVALAVQQIAK